MAFFHLQPSRYFSVLLTLLSLWEALLWWWWWWWLWWCVCCSARLPCCTALSNSPLTLHIFAPGSTRAAAAVAPPLSRRARGATNKKTTSSPSSMVLLVLWLPVCLFIPLSLHEGHLEVTLTHYTSIIFLLSLSWTPAGRLYTITHTHTHTSTDPPTRLAYRHTQFSIISNTQTNFPFFCLSPPPPPPRHFTSPVYTGEEFYISPHILPPQLLRRSLTSAELGLLLPSSASLPGLSWLTTTPPLLLFHWCRYSSFTLPVLPAVPNLPTFTFILFSTFPHLSIFPSFLWVITTVLIWYRSCYASIVSA